MKCKVYDTTCINAAYCNERDACCAGDMNCVPDPKEDMHTTNNEIPGTPNVWIMHNSDFSGECFVCWDVNKEAHHIGEWTVDGDMLLAGTIGEEPTAIVNYSNTEHAVRVPAWVIARAVATAVRRNWMNKLNDVISREF